MQSAQPLDALQTLRELARGARRKIAVGQETPRSAGEFEESQRGAMQTKVIAIDGHATQPMYVYGRTLRALEVQMGGNPERLFDSDGAPVVDEEFYEVTSAGIKRV